eukprot:1158760-Pelagomonas_calceolata.AAC.8
MQAYSGVGCRSTSLLKTQISPLNPGKEKEATCQSMLGVSPAGHIQAGTCRMASARLDTERNHNMQVSGAELAQRMEWDV